MMLNTTIERVYSIRSPYILYIHDAPREEYERTDFHIRSGDYFAMLAGALGFVEEALRECEAGTPTSTDKAELVQKMRKELVYLHKHYQINKAKEPKQFTDQTIRRF
jgi:hypothetical protein